MENREIEGDSKPGVLSRNFSTSIRQRISSMSQKLRATNAGGSSPGTQRKSNFFVEPSIPEARLALCYLVSCSCSVLNNALGYAIINQIASSSPPGQSRAHGKVASLHVYMLPARQRGASS